MNSASEAPSPTEVFLREVRRFAADGDVHRLFPALASHRGEPDKFSRLIAGIHAAEEMAGRLAGRAAALSGASCLLLDDTRALRLLEGDADRCGWHFASLEPGEKLRVRGDHPDATGVELLEAALGQDTAQVVRLGRGRDEARDTVLVFPATATPPALAQRFVPAGTEPRHCLLFLDQPGEGACRAALQPAFGLTDAETRVVCALLAVGDLQLAASRLGISINTARNQLRAVYGKVGVSRQAELLLVATQLTALHVHHSPADVFERAEAGPTPGFLPRPQGRVLAYRRYGVEGGTPVLWFHHLERSSLLPPGAEEAATELGLDLICVDQPGVGGSAPARRVDATAFADDHLAALEMLGIGAAHFVGATRGAGLALVAASRSPARCLSLTLAGGVPPIISSLPMGDDGNAGSHGLLQRNPWFMETYYRVLRFHIEAGAGHRMLRHLPRWSEHDARTLDARPELLDYLVTAALEAGRNDSRGVTDGLRVFIDPPEIDRAALPQPVHLLHGGDDRVFPLERLTDWLGAAQTRVRLFPGYGPLFSNAEVPAILACVREIADGA